MSEEWNQWRAAQDALEHDRLQGRVKEAAKRSPRYLRLAANMVRDDRVPAKAKAVLVAGGAYVVSPIDLMPGIIPVLGQIDDLIVIMLALGSATRLCPPELVDEHLAAVNLTHADMARDAESARLAGKWAVRRGAHVAKVAATRGARLAAVSARRGFERFSEWRADRALGA